MNAPLDVKNKNVARFVGFFGLYPVLAAFTRSYLHLQVPLDNLAGIFRPAFYPP